MPAKPLLVSIDFKINEAPFTRAAATLRRAASGVAMQGSMKEQGK